MEYTRLPPRQGLKYECELYLKQPLTPPQCKIIVAYRITNHRLAIGIGRWSTYYISRDNRISRFCSYNAIESRHALCWSVPYITSLEINFHRHLKNVILGSPKSLFQLDHQVSISLYLTEESALPHYRV
jgi:hypothetical protein